MGDLKAGEPAPSWARMDCFIIGEAESRGRFIQVSSQVANEFLVSVDGIIRHPNCDSQAVVRALCCYLHGSK